MQKQFSKTKKSQACLVYCVRRLLHYFGYYGWLTQYGRVLHILAYYLFCLPVPLGSIPELPAETCKEIKASEGRQALSGKYWFDSIITGKTVLAQCDMETEGGETKFTEKKYLIALYSNI